MTRYPSSSPSCTRTSASDTSSSQPENGSLLKKRYGSDREIDSYPLQARSPIASRFSFYLHPDPRFWGSSVYVGVPDHEEDDFLHEARSGEDIWDRHFSLFSRRWLTNVGCLGLVAIAIMALFIGYPIIRELTKDNLPFNGAFNLGGANATGQIPVMSFGIIDPDTPQEAMSYVSPTDGSTMYLVFSDEFNVDGRSFYPGDDPFWEALDLHYWGTNNLEWYDPSAITTRNGALQITLSQVAFPESNHNMSYRGGMLTTWNKFCFTGGMLLASVTLPGSSNVAGLWPAVWTLGNLGRAGYGSTLDGLWPYSYDACDVGTLKNQTLNGEPVAATRNGDARFDGALSFLPGQRLSRCTCPGESHPGPMYTDGSYMGRAAPEIDAVEAQVGDGVGHVSQSGQWAPFNEAYQWSNESTNYIIYNTAVTKWNDYKGGVYQQAVSAVSETDQNCYELNTGCFSTYGFEYKPGYDNAYITWINDNKPSWTLFSAGVGPDPAVEIAARSIPEEPMYLIVNLGLSESFSYIDFPNLVFPTTMSVDWIRVYQREGQKNIGCDPPDHPTSAYINQYIEAYTNWNLTTWVDDYKQTFPKNRLVDQC